MPDAKMRNAYYQGPVSGHFDGVHFFNPDGIEPLGFRDLMRWQFGGGRFRWPKAVQSPFPPAKPAERVSGEDLRVTMVGHATMLIQVAGLNILTDPVWSDRASPFSFAGPRRVSPPGIRFEDLPPIDIVLVSHNHYDHLDVRTLKRLFEEHGPHFVTPLGNDTIIHRAIPEAKISDMDWGDRLSYRDGVTIDAEPCHHWSARGTRDRRMALWAAFVISTPSGKIYHVGDTGFHDGINYHAVREKHGGFRLAILPFGAYEPRWFMKGQHQNPEEAVEGMQLANAAYVAGHHFATFQLTNEAIDAPVKALEEALSSRGIEPGRFRPLRAGEVLDVPYLGVTSHPTDDVTARWLEPWVSVSERDEYRTASELELRRELSTGHRLYGLQFKIIGRRRGTDDVLCQLNDGRVAQVHLTWKGSEEIDVIWPDTVIYASFDNWCKESLAADHAEWLDET